MKITLTLIGCVFLTACGKPAFHDPALQPFAVSFEQAAHRQGLLVDTTSIDMRLLDTITASSPNGGTTIGFCSGGDKPGLVIKKSYFEKAPEIRREQLLFHELGHCALKRAHLDTKIAGRPASIMISAPAISDADYQKFHDVYMQELFSVVTP